jgi:hypothetical protein
MDEAAYSYLLGLYLGDGHITRGRRNTISVARREAVARLDEFVGPKY